MTTGKAPNAQGRDFSFHTSFKERCTDLPMSARLWAQREKREKYACPVVHQDLGGRWGRRQAGFSSFPKCCWETRLPSTKGEREWEESVWISQRDLVSLSTCWDLIRQTPSSEPVRSFSAQVSALRSILKLDKIYLLKSLPLSCHAPLTKADPIVSYQSCQAFWTCVLDSSWLPVLLMVQVAWGTILCRH